MLTGWEYRVLTFIVVKHGDVIFLDTPSVATTQKLLDNCLMDSQ